MRLINRVILLLAGRGRRLGSLTEHCPKCLLDVAGMPILERALRALSQVGVTEAILVIGHKHEQIRYFAGQRCAGIDIQYVVNTRFAHTNTAYSLWLARNYLDTDCLLLEGDILFDTKALERILHCTNSGSVWAATPVTPGNDEGILLQKSKAGYVASVQLIRQTEDSSPYLSYKCAGIQVLTATIAESLAGELDVVINRGQVRIFADMVLGRLLTESSMKLCSLDGLRWAEVDDLKDLIRAQQLFEFKGSPSIIKPREPIKGEVGYGAIS